MGFWENIRESPKVAFVVLPFMAAGFGLVVVSLVTVNWVTLGFVSTGSDTITMKSSFAVWRMCVKVDGENVLSVDVCTGIPSAAFSTAQGLYGTGVALAFADFLAVIGFIGTAQFKTNRVSLIILAGSALATVFLAAGLGMTVSQVPSFGASLNGMSDVGNFIKGYGWGFFVACAGAGLYFLSSILSLFLSHRMRQLESTVPHSLVMNEIGV